MRIVTENQKLVEKYKKEYWKADRRRKSQILDDLQKITGQERKHLTKQILDHHDLQTKIKKYEKYNKLPKKTKYDFIQKQLVELWKISNYETGKRLVGSMPSLIDALTRHKEISYSNEKKKLLLQISAATIDRRLKLTRIEEKRLIKNTPGTVKGDLLKSQIPIRTHRDWVENKPGYLEIDTVHSCLGDLSGIYVLTLDTIDVYSGWSECKAMLGKSAEKTKNALSLISQKLPFNLKGIDFDEGVEFVNQTIIKYAQIHHITYTRSRTDRKNDQCFIEQNNDTLVRRYIGYGRYTSQEELLLINQIYDKLSDYRNFFLSTMRVKSKIYHDQKRLPIRHYSQAQTPYQKLMNSPYIPPEQKEQLHQRYLTLNPKKLKDEIDELRTNLIRLNKQLRPHDYFS
jgi:Integrase core domain.